MQLIRANYTCSLILDYFDPVRLHLSLYENVKSSRPSLAVYNYRFHTAINSGFPIFRADYIRN